MSAQHVCGNNKTKGIWLKDGTEYFEPTLDDINFVIRIRDFRINVFNYHDETIHDLLTSGI